MRGFGYAGPALAVAWALLVGPLAWAGGTILVGSATVAALVAAGAVCCGDLAAWCATRRWKADAVAVAVLAATAVRLGAALGGLAIALLLLPETWRKPTLLLTGLFYLLALTVETGRLYRRQQRPKDDGN
jgi:hypothetical protein